MKPKIVFMDASTVDLNDIDLSQLKKIGVYKSYSITHKNQVLSRLKNADIVLTNKVELLKNSFDTLKKLKLVCVTATGVNNIDLQSAKKNKIAVTNVAGYSTPTVAEHTLMFMLALTHRLLKHHAISANGIWSHSPHFSVLDYPFCDLNGKTVGIIGYGQIGKRVALLCKAFGMKVLIGKIPGRKYASSRIPLKTLLNKSDFVLLHCALSDNTKFLIGKKEISFMKKSSFLINMARGPVVVENAVADALIKNKISGYATDVMVSEPPPKNHPFFNKKLKDKILLTPHIAWASVESRQRLIDEIVLNIDSFLKGKKRNRIV